AACSACVSFRLASRLRRSGALRKQTGRTGSAWKWPSWATSSGWYSRKKTRTSGMGHVSLLAAVIFSTSFFLASARIPVGTSRKQSGTSGLLRAGVFELHSVSEEHDPPGECTRTAFASPPRTGGEGPRAGVYQPDSMHPPPRRLTPKFTCGAGLWGLHFWETGMARP